MSGIFETTFVAHYALKEHKLEVRVEIPLDLWAELSKGLPINMFFVGLSSIFWREAWKYGERAFCYCNHDVGHAIGAVSIVSAFLGWDTKLIDDLSCDQLDVLLGLVDQKEVVSPERPVKGYMPKLEQEHADYLLVVFSGNVSGGSQPELRINHVSLSSVIYRFRGIEFKGRPNALSKEHVYWDIIYRTANAVKKPFTEF